MQTIYIKWALAGAIVLAMFGAGYHYGELNSAKVYIPQLEQIKAAIEASNQAAKLIVQNQEEIYHAAKTKSANDVARIHAYYDRLLLAGSAANANAVTKSPCGVDAATGQPTAAGQDFERKCVVDAQTVVGWQQWAIGNHLPVE